MDDKSSDEASTEYNLIINILKILSAIFLCLMMCVTFSDVIGRYFFNSPISGATEIISFLLGLTIFSAFPLVTRDRGHITVSLFERFFQNRIRYMQRLFVLLVSIIIVIFVAWLMFDQALTMLADGTPTEYLDLPEAPIVFIFGGLSGVAAIIFISIIWQYISLGGDPDEENVR